MCAVASAPLGGQRPSVADYVMVTGDRDGRSPPEVPKDRSVLADNLGHGLAHNGVNMSFVNIIVMRSAIHRNLGNGVDARGPGYVVVSENGILSNDAGIRGEHGAVYANANTLASQRPDSSRRVLRASTRTATTQVRSVALERLRRPLAIDVTNLET